MYAAELKTWTDEHGYRDAIAQTAHYGKQLGLAEISLVFLWNPLMMATGKNMKKIKGMRKTVLYQIAIEKMLTNKADRNFRVSKKPDFSEKSGFLDRRSHGKTDSIVSVQQRIGIMAETVFAATGN